MIYFRKKCPGVLQKDEKIHIFAILSNMVPIVQLVRMSDCGSEGRGFEPHLAPRQNQIQALRPAGKTGLFYVLKGPYCALKGSFFTF